MANPIEIIIIGADKLAANLKKFGTEIRQTINAAGEEAGKEIIGTIGLQKYPPATSANLPPTPYYIRGRGMQYKSRNNMKSERYGTQFYIKREASGTIIGNRSSYAKWLAGEHTQVERMGIKGIGWRKLIEVAKEKIGIITKIYQNWTDRLIKKLNL